MGFSLAFRACAALGLLVGACSQGSTPPAPATDGSEAGASSPDDSDPQTPPGGASAGGAGGLGTAADAGAAAIAAGASDTEAGAPNSGVFPPDSAGAVSTPVTWKTIVEAMGNTFVSTPAAASRENDAAVAYVERPDATPATARVVLQRFDASGERVGPLLTLGTDPTPQSGVTLASDGTQYAACWDAAAEVHCSLVDEEGHVQLNALSLDGQLATLVASPTGWLLAYATSDTELRLQPLTSALEPTGSAVDLQRSPAFRYPKAAPLLAPTPSGFALVGASSEDGHEQLLRLNAKLKPVGSAIPLGHDFWFFGQLIASDTRAAVSLSAPYGSYLMLLDKEKVVAELPISGGGKTGMDEAFLLTNGGIGSAWLTPDAQVRHRFFRDAHEAEVGLGSRDGGPLLGMPEEGTESYQQLLQVAGQTLIVGRAYRYGYGAIQVAALTFP